MARKSGPIEGFHGISGPVPLPPSPSSSSGPTKAPEGPSVAAGLCAFLALAIPLAVTALRLGVSPQWRDDVAVVETLGFVPIGGEGAPSALLAQLAALLPIGGRVLRAGLVGALGTGIAGRAVFGMALGLLRRSGDTPRLSPWLALAAALTATLAPTFQAQGTALGGGTLAAGLGLVVLVARQGARPSDARVSLGLGLVLGLVLAENRIAALAVVASLGIRAAISGEMPKRRALVLSTVAALVVATFCAVPLLIRPFAEHSWLSLGLDLSPRASLQASATLSPRGPIGAWASDLGPLALGLGVAGLAWGLARKALRADSAALALPILGAALFAAQGRSVLASEPFAALTLLALGAAGTFAVLGVQTAGLFLARARIPLSGPAAVMLVVFHFTLVFAALEGSSDVVTETTGLGADVWTDEALGELPFGALLIVRSPTLAWRLWSARITRGERPDLIVVPLALLGRGSVARDLVAEEPALAPLIRDVSMTGATSEYALSTLADSRPLYVELDPTWDKRLFDHLRPTPLWLGFTAHTLGRSDRAIAVADDSGRRAFRRVLSVAKGVPGGDPATLAVLSARAHEQAVVLAALGDKDSARRVLADVARIEPESAFATKIETRLKTRGPFDPRALLE
jgi:hypothetical protein